MDKKKLIIIISIVGVVFVTAFGVLGTIVFNNVIASSTLNYIEESNEKKKEEEKANEELKENIKKRQELNNKTDESDNNTSNTTNDSQNNTTNNSSNNSSNNNNATEEEKIVNITNYITQKGDYLYYFGVKMYIPHGYSYIAVNEESGASAVSYVNRQTYETIVFMVIDNPLRDATALLNQMDTQIQFFGTVTGGPINANYGNKPYKIYGLNIQGQASHAYVTTTDDKFVFIAATGEGTIAWMKPTLETLTYY